MKTKFFLILVLLLSLPTVWPLFRSGYFPMHDDTQVSRVIVMGNAIKDGQFPVRWVADLGYGYGYPIFNFYGPLPYYFGGLLYALGVDALVATKVMFGAGLLLAGITMFFLGKKLFGATGGLLASMLYVYAPYHAVQMYVRGAVGELWAVGFLPLVLLGAFRRPVLGGLGLALVILSHTILGFVTVIFYIFSCVFYYFYCIIKRTVHRPLLTVHCSPLLLGLTLSAFFWLPALTEMNFTSVKDQIGPTADFRDHFVCLSQLWDSPWGFGGSARGCIDGMSFKIGKIAIVLTILTMGGFILKKALFQQKTFMVAVSGSIISLFLLLEQSKFLWDIIKPFAYLQYPWRFLSFVTVAISVAAAYIVRLVPTKPLRVIVVLTLVILTIAGNAQLFVPQFTHGAAGRQFENKEDLRWRVSKISDEYLPPNFSKPSDMSQIAVDILSGVPKDAIERQIENSQYVKVFITNPRDTQIRLNRVFFPGWRYYVDEKEVQPIIIDGLPSFVVSQGRHAIELRFGNTPVRTIGNFISLLALCVLLYRYGHKIIA